VEYRLDNLRFLRTSVVIVAALAIVLLAPAAAFAAYAPWVTQKSGTTQTLRGVAFATSNLGCAVGSGGTILRTTNGGATWSAVKSGTTQTLYGVAFATATNGWAVGGGGTILRTTNGGATWAAQLSRTTQTLNAVACADASTCWAVGNRATVLHTTDGGTTWGLQSTGLKKNATLRTVSCSGASVAWIAGNGGTVRKTTTGGSSWTAQSTGTGQTLNGSVAVDASHVRVVGSGGTVRATSNGGSTWTAEGTSTTQALSGVATAGAGNAWAVGGGGTILAYSPDLTAPATTATGLQADEHSGWTNTSVSVTLSAVDAGRAGVAATYYTVNGGVRLTYATSFVVSGQGSHPVTYWSVDQAGNVEGVHTGFVNIDMTPPTIGSDADGAWHADDVTVHLNAGDTGGSGLAGTQYRPGGAPDWLPTSGDAFVVAAAVGDGPHTYEFRAVDAAGNVSPTGSCTVKIDATAPTTTATGLGADILSDWSTPATTRIVSLAADDGAGSGVGSIRYTLDGVEKTYTGSFSVSGLGQHQVTYWSTDNVGHVGAVRVGWVNIADFYAQSQGLAADETSGWYNGTANITITPGGPGELSICYQLDGGATQTVVGSASFPVGGIVDGVGHHKVEFWALQGSLPSAHQTGYVNIDTTKPMTTLVTPAPTRWVNRAVALTYKATDVSGIEATYSKVNGAAPLAGAELLLPAPLTHAGDGRFVVQYWSVDGAGNTGTAKSVTVKIDTVRPTVSARYATSVLRYATAKLRFVVKDTTLYRYGVKAAARIVIKNSHNHVVKTIKKSVKTGVGSTASFRCTLARGTYRFYVYATDPAGNKQVKVVSNKLTVR
jgi:photosystem II stability/assembly factor-like uncharacterized protein